MPTGGALTIETSSLVLDGHVVGITAGAAAPGAYAVVTVRDSGHGMDAETIQRIFEPFFTTKEVGKGTGLGLATCYGIVKQSGGFMSVESEPGRGAIFRVHLPRVDERAHARCTLAPRASCLGFETVLLVEDDDPLRAAVTRILEARGYRVLATSGGVEALDTARAHQGNIDLVLSDVIMPDASGPEVVDRLRERLPGLRSLFITGYTDHPLLRSRAMEIGVDLVEKPFTPDVLAKQVRAALDRPRSPQVLGASGPS